MSPEHLIGIEVIDQQHQEIHEVVVAAIQAIESEDKWHIVHYILVRLTELLRYHFDVEEALMQILDYPEIKPHQMLHREYLARVQAIRDATLQRDVGAGESLDSHHISFLSHILDHDKKLADYIRTNSAFFKR